MNIDQVPALARAASQIGPDFYAVLLVPFVAAGAGWLLFRAQNSRPPLTREQLRPYRLSFYISGAYGLLAIAVSMGLWIFKEIRGIHTMQVAITDIAPNIKIDSRYFSKTTFHHNTADGTLVNDTYFLIVSNQPFSEKDSFSFDIVVSNVAASSSQFSCTSGGGIAKKKPLSIQFDGKPIQSYRLEIDSSASPQLKPISTTSTHNLFSRDEVQFALITDGSGK